MNSAAHFIVTEPDGSRSLNALVEGMHCASCVATIERNLLKRPEVREARVNLSTRRLHVVWRGDEDIGGQLIDLIGHMGYHAEPFDPKTAETSEKREMRFLLICMAVAGFASGNLMLFSVPLWSSDRMEMGAGTTAMFHWVQALIAVPAAVFSGLPFFRSAWNVLREGRTNMDVPISVAVILTVAMSLFETITFGRHAYFDSITMLLFFLLIGRYLEARARGRARGAAQDLLHMMSGHATVLSEDGKHESVPFSELKEGMLMLVAAGEKIGADGVVVEGESELDTSLITGETRPMPASPGSALFAGAINMAGPLTIRVTRAGEKSLVAEIVRLMETAEQGQARYVTLADRISRWYTPAVHILAASTFIGWLWLGGIVWEKALLHAATVLIITCPCALGLAVPVVQVLASGWLMRRGILLKSGSALERLAGITHAVFDKTGTLTLGRPMLQNAASLDAEDFKLAASLAARSKHPLSKALAAAYTGPVPAVTVVEVPGHGLEAQVDGLAVRLGRRSWAAPSARGAEEGPELWLARDGRAPVRFAFADQLRADAGATIATLQAAGIKTLLLSGDRDSVAQETARTVRIESAAGDLTPVQKTERIAALKASGARVLMVGDGLNDAPSLAAANVSISPSSALDITQNSADAVFQGEKLGAIVTAWRCARLSVRLVRENFILATLYNVIAVPVAIAGYVTPLIAALAMSSSSLIVIANAMRLNLLREAK